MKLTFTLPVKTVSPQNNAWGVTKQAMFAKARKRKLQRKCASLSLRAAMANHGLTPIRLLPCVVTLTRLSAGRLDPFDALPGSLKSVVDGLADALGVDDGGPFVTWKAEQEKCKPRTYGVRVEIVRVATKRPKLFPSQERRSQ